VVFDKSLEVNLNCFSNWIENGLKENNLKEKRRPHLSLNLGPELSRGLTPTLSFPLAHGRPAQVANPFPFLSPPARPNPPYRPIGYAREGRPGKLRACRSPFSLD